MLQPHPERLCTTQLLPFEPNSNEHLVDRTSRLTALAWDLRYRGPILDQTAEALRNIHATVPMIQKRAWRAAEIDQRNRIMTFCANHTEGSGLSWDESNRLVKEPKRPRWGQDRKQRDDARQAWNLHRIMQNDAAQLTECGSAPQDWATAPPTTVEELTNDGIRRTQALHAELMAGCENEALEAGRWRSSNSAIPEPPYVFALRANVDRFVRQTWQLALTMPSAITASIMLDFGMIIVHPFADGNGRTTRLLTNEFLTRYGLAEMLHTHQTRNMLVTARATAERTGNVEPLAQAWIDGQAWTNRLPWNDEDAMLAELTRSRHIEPAGTLAQQLDAITEGPEE